MTNSLRVFSNVASFTPKYLWVLTLTAALTACGGGGGGGSSSTGGGATASSAAVGTVTAIGSVELNGIHYDCLKATVVTDDGTVDQGSGDRCVASNASGHLKTGMIVKVTGVKNADGSYSATRVETGHDVIGPATNINASALTFTVLDQTILVDNSTRFEINSVESVGTPATSLAELSGKIVEVNGQRNESGQILATFVETKSALPRGGAEIKGIATVSGGVVTIGALTIDLGTQTAPPNGACVEAKGNLNAAGDTLTLTRPLSIDDDCNGSKLSGSLSGAEVEGVVNRFTSLMDFKVGTQPVTTNASTIYKGGTGDDLLNGVKVEVEGSVTDGVLLARKVEIKQNGVRIHANADGAGSGNSVNVLGITVTTDASTRGASVTSIGAGDRIRVEGVKIGPKSIRATRLERDSSGGGSGGEHSGSGSGGGTSQARLRGPLDTDASAGLAILGVPITTNSSTKFEGASVSSATAGTIVQVKGDESPDNAIVASEVERDD